jgi:hypothetical protein
LAKKLEKKQSVIGKKTHEESQSSDRQMNPLPVVQPPAEIMEINLPGGGAAEEYDIRRNAVIDYIKPLGRVI